MTKPASDWQHMELHLPNLLSFEATSLFALLLFLYIFLGLGNHKNSQRKPPQPSGSWPVIGHLLLLGKLPHISLANLADKYGSIFMIKLGVRRALVVSSPDMARECLATYDKVFVNRPRMIFMEHLGYNFAMLGFSPYGQYWRDMRKITSLNLFSNHSLQMSQHLRMSEVRSEIKVIYDDYKEKKRLGAGSGAEFVDMKTWFSDISLNTSVRLIAGKSLNEFYQGEEYEQCKKAFRNFSKLASSFVLADVFPFLRWLDIGGYEKSMKKVAEEIDRAAQGWLEMHKRKEITGEDNEKHGFMDVMLGIISTGVDTPSGYDADVIIKSTCMAMILGGSNTSAVTLTWALSLLLNHRDSLEKVQAELDNQVGRQRQVVESDLRNLVYLQAILKETMRLYPAAPLSLPREAITDCTINGYHIPSGTRLFVNLYKIHRDPQVWPDPLAFHPERFLTTHKEFDVKGQNFELIPFGSGRRICPGISLSLQTMLFTLANLLHGFEILTPLGEKVDMTEGIGLTNPKASPLKVILIPRLTEKLYDNLLL